MVMLSTSLNLFFKTVIQHHLNVQTDKKPFVLPPYTEKHYNKRKAEARKLYIQY